MNRSEIKKELVAGIAKNFMEMGGDLDSYIRNHIETTHSTTGQGFDEYEIFCDVEKEIEKRVNQIAESYDAEVESVNVSENTFSLSKKFDVDQYLDYAFFDEQSEKWIDQTTGKEICDGGYHIVSILEFRNLRPVSSQYYFGKNNTASMSASDDVDGVVDLWEV